MFPLELNKWRFEVNRTSGSAATVRVSLKVCNDLRDTRFLFKANSEIRLEISVVYNNGEVKQLMDGKI